MFQVVHIVYMQQCVMILMTDNDTLEDIVERLINLPREKKQELARLASEASARRRARQGT